MKFEITWAAFPLSGLTILVGYWCSERNAITGRAAYLPGCPEREREREREQGLGTL
jgi:hypothetical protein